MFYSARLFSVWMLVLCIGLLTGCENSPTGEPATSAKGNGGQNSAAPGEREGQADEEVVLTLVDRAGYDAAIEAHRGKVVLVDFWATWCNPCMKQFPLTMALAKEHAGDGLVVIKVSLDSPDDPAAKQKVVNFLRNQGSFENNLLANLSTSEAMEQFEIEEGAVPFYRLYDREGQPRHTFIGHDDELHERVKELLGEN